MTAPDRFAFALGLVRDAGDLAHGYFRRRGELQVKSKGLQDMASQADMETELLIRGRLAEAYPGDAFLGEETGMSEFAPGQGIWVVDPIDGTQPFISGLTSWCVSIAYVREGVLQFGMVYAPARDELFAGGLEHPASLNGQPVERHPGQTIREGMIGAGYSTRLPPETLLAWFGPFLKQGGMFYRDGSGALTLCYVAAGRLLGYLEAQINSWDCLGAIAVIHAAGLKTNAFLDNDGLRVGNWLIAANDGVYAELERLMFPG